MMNFIHPLFALQFFLSIQLATPKTMAEPADTEDPYRDIEFEEIKSRLEDGSLLVIDVRTPEELKNGNRIPKTVNIPLPEVPDVFKLPEDEFKAKMGFDKPGKDSEMAFSCRSGRRAEAAVMNMLDLGYNKLRLYKGSYMDWVDNGGPTE